MSPWRKDLYKALSNITLAGCVLDIGGSRKSGYHELFQGAHTYEISNIDAAQDAEHCFNLEYAFPLTDGSYDAVLAINVLEHIYAHQLVLAECNRVLKKGGTLVIAVPFLMFVHPSPHDHWRYTEETLRKLLAEAQFTNIDVHPIGNGPGAVFVQLLGGVRGGKYARVLAAPIFGLFDAILSMCMARKQLATRFPLGYVVTATA